MTVEQWHWEALAKFAKKHKWQIGAELGVRFGRTSRYLLANCDQLSMIGVDVMGPIDGNQKTKDWPWARYDAEVSELEEAFPERFKMYRMRMSRAAKFVADGQLDFIFIDGDHSKDAVLCDLRCWAPKVKDDGIITGHDINLETVKDAVEKVFGKDYLHYGERYNNLWWAEKCSIKMKLGECDEC